MEHLLNVKEAAEYLNVSEMTIRRWTNDGLLPCYRIGRRRARRFRQEDLLAFLEGKKPEALPEKRALGFNDIQVPDGSHLTHLSRDPTEALNVAVSFVLEGLLSKETVYVVAPETPTESIAGGLERHFNNLGYLKSTGKLFFSRGMDSPGDQMEFLSKAAIQSDGPFRVFGDMTWALEKGWKPEKIEELEKDVENSSGFDHRLFLCQYKLDQFSSRDIMMAVETHRHRIYRGKLEPNRL